MNATSTRKSFPSTRSPSSKLRMRRVGNASLQTILILAVGASTLMGVKWLWSTASIADSNGMQGAVKTLLRQALNGEAREGRSVAGTFREEIRGSLGDDVRSNRGPQPKPSRRGTTETMDRPPDGERARTLTPPNGCGKSDEIDQETKQHDSDSGIVNESDRKKYNVYLTQDRAGLWVFGSSRGMTYLQDPETGEVHKFRESSFGFDLSKGAGIAYCEQEGTMYVPRDFDPRSLQLGYQNTLNYSGGLGIGGAGSIDKEGNMLGGYCAGAFMGFAVGASETRYRYVGTYKSLEDAGFSTILLRGKRPRNSSRDQTSELQRRVR